MTASGAPLMRWLQECQNQNPCLHLWRLLFPQQWKARRRRAMVGATLVTRLLLSLPQAALALLPR